MTYKKLNLSKSLKRGLTVGVTLALLGGFSHDSVAYNINNKNTNKKEYVTTNKSVNLDPVVSYKQVPDNYNVNEFGGYLHDSETRNIYSHEDTQLDLLNNLNITYEDGNSKDNKIDEINIDMSSSELNKLLKYGDSLTVLFNNDGEMTDGDGENNDPYDSAIRVPLKKGKTHYEVSDVNTFTDAKIYMTDLKESDYNNGKWDFKSVYHGRGLEFTIDKEIQKVERKTCTTTNQNQNDSTQDHSFRWYDSSTTEKKQNEDNNKEQSTLQDNKNKQSNKDKTKKQKFYLVYDYDNDGQITQEEINRSRNESVNVSNRDLEQGRFYYFVDENGDVNSIDISNMTGDNPTLGFTPYKKGFFCADVVDRETGEVYGSGVCFNVNESEANETQVAKNNVYEPNQQIKYSNEENLDLEGLVIIEGYNRFTGKWVPLEDIHDGEVISALPLISKYRVRAIDPSVSSVNINTHSNKDSEPAKGKERPWKNKEGGRSIRVGGNILVSDYNEVKTTDIKNEDSFVFGYNQFKVLDYVVPKAELVKEKKKVKTYRLYDPEKDNERFISSTPKSKNLLDRIKETKIVKEEKEIEVYSLKLKEKNHVDKKGQFKNSYDITVETEDGKKGKVSVEVGVDVEALVAAGAVLGAVGANNIPMKFSNNGHSSTPKANGSMSGGDIGGK